MSRKKAQGTADFQVFISHSSLDTWVARQIAHHLQQCGAKTFLDEADIEYGDDFEARILAAAQVSEELLVLLTPWSVKRPYIWLETGIVWGRGKRIVGVLHGLSASELFMQEGIPALLKRISLVEINQLDSYFKQVRGRIARWRPKDG